MAFLDACKAFDTVWHEGLFKPGAHQLLACAWFLIIASVRECQYACVCVFVCVSAPEAINNESHYVWTITFKKVMCSSSMTRHCRSMMFFSLEVTIR